MCRLVFTGDGTFDVASATPRLKAKNCVFSS